MAVKKMNTNKSEETPSKAESKMEEMFASHILEEEEGKNKE